MNACECVRFQCILFELQNYYKHLEKKVQQISAYLYNWPFEIRNLTEQPKIQFLPYNKHAAYQLHFPVG